MGRFGRVVLIVVFLIFNLGTNALAVSVCIVDSYKIAVTKKVYEQLAMALSHDSGISYARYGNSHKCDVKIILGTPGVVKELKSCYPYEKVIYTFVMFPEMLGLDKKENFYGIRIFPLPERTVNEFFSYTKMKRDKVAVVVSRKFLSIAKKYLHSKIFTIIPINSRTEEAFSKLEKFKYIYIFPDPGILKVSNFLALVSYSKYNHKILIAGLPDLNRYDVNFIYAVDFNRLTQQILKLVKTTPSTHILPCPAKIKVWEH